MEQEFEKFKRKIVQGLERMDRQWRKVENATVTIETGRITDVVPLTSRSTYMDGIYGATAWYTDTLQEYVNFLEEQLGIEKTSFTIPVDKSKENTV